MRYFAYGSLLSRARMSDLCPDADPLFPARIPHHRISFTGNSAQWKGGTATVALATGSELWGGVYEIEADCRGAVEAHGREENYAWSWTSVESMEGERQRVGLLVKVRDLNPSEPSSEYLKAVEEGRRDWGLDAADLDLSGGESAAP